MMTLSDLYQALESVLKDKVFYGSNVYDNEDNASMPYIVYQEVTNRPSVFSDDTPICYRVTIQITMVTKKKDRNLEKKLEQVLLKSGFAFSLLSEFKNQDKSLNRVYEIIMEEINDVS